jgi:hypothetical protein
MYAPEDRAAAGGAARRLAMEHLYRYVRRGQQWAPLQIYKIVLHTYADVSIHQQHPSASVSVRRGQQRAPLQIYKVVLCQHTSAYVSIRQHTSGQQRPPLKIYKVGRMRMRRMLLTYAEVCC